MSEARQQLLLSYLAAGLAVARFIYDLGSTLGPLVAGPCIAVGILGILRLRVILIRPEQPSRRG